MSVFQKPFGFGPNFNWNAQNTFTYNHKQFVVIPPSSETNMVYENEVQMVYEDGQGMIYE